MQTCSRIKYKVYEYVVRVWPWQSARASQETSSHPPLLCPSPLLEPRNLAPLLSTAVVPTVPMHTPEDVRQGTVLPCRAVEATSNGPIKRRRVGVISSLMLHPHFLMQEDEDTSTATTDAAAGILRLQPVPVVEEPSSSTRAPVGRRLHAPFNCQGPWIQLQE